MNFHFQKKLYQKTAGFPPGLVVILIAVSSIPNAQKFGYAFDFESLIIVEGFRGKGPRWCMVQMSGDIRD
jgi:hypothetical protein